MEQKKYALVTGASSGMGLEYARQLAAQGYPLVVVSNEEVMRATAVELQTAYGVDVRPVVMDLSTEEAPKALYSFCQSNHLDVEVLINNAGVYHDRDFLDDSEGFNRLILMLHMVTPAMLCYYFGQDMTARGKGFILNVCSITSQIAVQRLASYGATKAFLTNFTRSLHVELASKGVVVTDVSPGAVDTGLYSIRSMATQMGKALGYIVTPQYLVKRALRALFKGKAKVTVPLVWNKVLLFFVALIPTWVLRLIRKWGIF